jgi:hypothetical protein
MNVALDCDWDWGSMMLFEKLKNSSHATVATTLATTHDFKLCSLKTHSKKFYSKIKASSLERHIPKAQYHGKAALAQEITTVKINNSRFN